MAGIYILVFCVVYFHCKQQSHRDLAVTALEKLIKSVDNTGQIFTAIRCLLRIKLTIMDANPQNKLLVNILYALEPAILECIIMYVKIQ